MAESESTCSYCGVGGGVIIESHDGCVAGVRRGTDHRANFGRLCAGVTTLCRSADRESRHLELRRLAAMSAGARAVRS
jgi:assimilatory nitrate reductase catalytic subunit